MQRSKLELPLPDAMQHATEGEKADWHFGDEDEAAARFEQALENGTLEVRRGDSAVQAKAATIYLPSGDMELAAQQARALGMNTAAYLETVVRRAIHQKAAA